MTIRILTQTSHHPVANNVWIWRHCLCPAKQNKTLTANFFRPQEVIPGTYHPQLFAVISLTLENSEPRFVPLPSAPAGNKNHPSSILHRTESHTDAVALINFCESITLDTLLPYLDSLVERLFKLLNAPGDCTRETTWPGADDNGTGDDCGGE